MDLAAIAKELNKHLTANKRDDVTDENRLDVQAMCVAEEAGEFLGAYRRYTGRARRNGSLEDLEHEIADVLIATAVFAEQFGVDINQVVEDKLRIIYSRGWKEE
jgi:NTP pyrophosphatase (non-canonical NTP hydrolase)